jgi:hypothetical protein
MADKRSVKSILDNYPQGGDIGRPWKYWTEVGACCKPILVSHNNFKQAPLSFLTQFKI